MKNRIIVLLTFLVCVGCSEIETKKKMVVNETYEVTYTIKDFTGNITAIQTQTFNVKGDQDRASDGTDNFVLEKITENGPETILLKEKIKGKIGTLEYEIGDLRLEKPEGHKFPYNTLVTFYNTKNLDKTEGKYSFYVDIKKK